MFCSSQSFHKVDKIVCKIRVSFVIHMEHSAAEAGGIQVRVIDQFDFLHFCKFFDFLIYIWDAYPFLLGCLVLSCYHI